MALKKRFARLSLVAALSSLGLFVLIGLTQIVAPVATVASAGIAANAVVGETCFATPNNGATVYSSTTAQAVRDAVAAAPAGGQVKIAGYCAGVSGAQVVNTGVMLTLSGGYTLMDWTVANPLANPTTLDALGGGKVLFANGAIALTDLILKNGNSSFAGGGAWFNDTATLNNVTFSNNRTTAGGGGAYFENNATLNGTTFISNTAASGGGAEFHNVTLLSSTTFISNTANSGGGAFFSFASMATLSGITFTSNTAANGGGAFFNGIATLSSATFTGNTAALGGGAYFAGPHPRQFTNALFNRNRATGQGWAIYVANTNPLTLRHATLISPTLVSGTAVYVANGTVNLTNTLIASYTVGLARAGGTVNEDYNLFANVATPYSGTIFNGINSLTGTAGFYNTTAYTLTPNSSALDHGINLNVTTDYFGNPRPRGLASDIGYAESPYTYTLLYTLTAQPAHLFANGLDEALLTFTATDLLGNGAHLAGRAVTFTANSLGTLVATNLTLNANGAATTTYTVGLIPGTAPLTATMLYLGVTDVATTSVALKPNPLVGSLWAQFGEHIITYTFVVTNVDVMTQTVVMSGSVPVGGSVIAVTGGISVPTGGDYGWGYVEAGNIILAPDAGYTLQWTIQLSGFTGDVVTQGHAESTQARLRLPATLRVYRQLLMPVYKPEGP